MAFGVNRAEVIGRLGGDVNISSLTSGDRVASFSVATDDSYVDKQSGDRVDRTQWHRVVTYQKGLVDMFEKYGRKGRLIFVAGKLRSRKWRRKGEDEDRSTTEIVLVPGSEVQFLDRMDGNGAKEESSAETASGAASEASAGENEDIPL